MNILANLCDISIQMSFGIAHSEKHILFVKIWVIIFNMDGYYVAQVISFTTIEQSQK